MGSLSGRVAWQNCCSRGHHRSHSYRCNSCVKLDRPDCLSIRPIETHSDILVDALCACLHLVVRNGCLVGQNARLASLGDSGYAPLPHSSGLSLCRGEQLSRCWYDRELNRVWTNYYLTVHSNTGSWLSLQCTGVHLSWISYVDG